MIYFDNSSTTRPVEKSVEAVLSALTVNWGNPSSLHTLGFNAENIVNEAKRTVASAINSREDEIYFTSCGTESNNTAVFGAAYKGKKRGFRIVTTAIEHPSVLEAVKRLEDEGFEVIRIKPESDGNINEEAIKDAIDDKTVLVSVMLVNNETGVILPVKNIKKFIKEKNAPALFHCDAVQAFGKLPIDVNKIGADFLSVSGHKIGAPKGIGVLYVKKGVTVKPLLFGGGQQNGFRSGTECVPLIAGLSAAVKELGNIKENLEKQYDFCKTAKEKLNGTGFVKINSPKNALPYILNISVPGYRSETLLHFLEQSEIYVSSGSACSKGKGSYVLGEMGLDKKTVDSALRLSFSKFNTQEEIDIFIKELEKAVKSLKRSN